MHSMALKYHSSIVISPMLPNGVLSELHGVTTRVARNATVMSCVTAYHSVNAVTVLQA